MIDLPSMYCDPYCGECGCKNNRGEIVVFTWEWNIIEHYINEQKISVDLPGENCPFYQKGQCSIHPVKPFVCQLLGHSDSLKCNRGYDVPIPDDRERLLRQENMKGEFKLLRERLGGD